MKLASMGVAMAYPGKAVHTHPAAAAAAIAKLPRSSYRSRAAGLEPLATVAFPGYQRAAPSPFFVGPHAQEHVYLSAKDYGPPARGKPGS